MSFERLSTEDKEKIEKRAQSEVYYDMKKAEEEELHGTKGGEK